MPQPWQQGSLELLHLGSSSMRTLLWQPSAHGLQGMPLLLSNFSPFLGRKTKPTTFLSLHKRQAVRGCWQTHMLAPGLTAPEGLPRWTSVRMRALPVLHPLFSLGCQQKRQQGPSYMHRRQLPTSMLTQTQHLQMMAASKYPCHACMRKTGHAPKMMPTNQCRLVRPLLLLRLPRHAGMQYNQQSLARRLQPLHSQEPARIMWKQLSIWRLMPARALGMMRRS